MQPSKPKVTYGKRNGNRSRLLARDSNSPSPARPFFDRSIDGPKSFSSPASPVTKVNVSSSDDENDSKPKPAPLKKRASTQIDQNKDSVDDSILDFPDSPPREALKLPSKSFTDRRERAIQKEREILQKQAEARRRKNEAQERKRVTVVKPTPPQPLVFDDSAHPLSPPSCVSIGNSPEPEPEPETPVVSRQSSTKSLSQQSNSPIPPAIPALKRRRQESPPVDLSHNKPQEKKESESIHVSPAPPPNRAVAPTRSRVTQLNVKSVTQAEKDTWSFLEDMVPVVKKPKLVANLGPSKFDQSDSDTDGEDQQETQADDLQVADSNYASLVERMSGTSQEEEYSSSQSMQAPRAVFTGRKTYGAVRSYLSQDLAITDKQTDGAEPAMDFMDQLGLVDREDSPPPEVEEEFGGNLKTVHELRTLGGNTRFQDEVQYIMDGLSGAISNRRSSLLELAEKCLDREFIQDFKVSSMAGEFFTLVKNEDDPVATFLIGFVVCSMMHGEKNIGLAASLIQSYEIVPLLMLMLQDRDDMKLVVRRKKLSVSKIFQQLLIEFLKKMSLQFFQSEDSGAIYSQSLIALSAFATLQGLEDKVDMMLLKGMSQTANIDAILDFGHELYLDISPIERVFSIEDDEGKFEFKNNLHLMHLLTRQLGFIMSDSTSQALIKGAELRSSDNYLLDLWRLLGQVSTSWDRLVTKLAQDWINNVSDFAITMLKLFISITTNFGYQQVIEMKFSRRVNLLKNIYEPEAAKILVSFMVQISHHPVPKSQIRTNNLELFSWGLMVNLCESEAVCEHLLAQEELAKLKLFFNQELVKGASLSGHKFHCQGYQSLVAGMLIAVKGGEAFSAGEKTKIREKLDAFKASLSESWGQGLRNQVSRVLSSL